MRHEIAECYTCVEMIVEGDVFIRFMGKKRMLYFHNEPIKDLACYNDFKHTAEYRRIIASRRQ